MIKLKIGNSLYLIQKINKNAIEFELNPDEIPIKKRYRPRTLNNNGADYVDW